ncbi:hypothetical protein BDY24DRAFT_3677 [Mrakia frigida]|uniref:bZIP transcription factor n=1 Tax=Mrakia frigida TaxID=29902 RepID=UPI003FCBFAD4
MKYPTDKLSEAEKLELTRERNRKKQSALRERRAKRVRELEEENAKLASLTGTTPLPIPKKGARSKQPSSSPPHQPVASTSGTSGGERSEKDEREVWSPTRSDEEVARLTGVCGRLVERLRGLGVGEAEIGRLIAGREEGSDTGSKIALPQLGFSPFNPSSPHLRTSPTSQERSSLQLPQLPPVESSQNSYAPSPHPGSTEESSVFPFAFLFADNHSVTSLSHPSPFDSQPNASSSTSSPLTPLPLDSTASHTPNSLSIPNSPRNHARSPLVDVVMGENPNPAFSTSNPPSDPATLLHQLADLATLNQPPTIDDDIPLNKQLSVEWQKKLFEINSSHGTQRLTRDQSSAIDAPAIVSEELAGSTQLLILRLLGETSSQKRLYDDERVLSQEDRTYLESTTIDKRLQFFPDPLARLTIAKASESGQLNLTTLLSELIDETTIYGDVWDVTGWKLPSSFCSRYPPIVPQSPLGLASGYFAAPRPIPATLRGATIQSVELHSYCSLSLASSLLSIARER